MRNKAIALGADRWLEELPTLVGEIEREWHISVGAVFPDATEALVAAATTLDGEPAVLKLIVPRDGEAARREIAVLELAAGEGCARLLRSDAERGALLMERLGPSMADLDLPFQQRLEILCSAAQLMWRPAPGVDLPTGAQKGQWLIDYIATTWRKLDRPCSERAVDHAIACATRRIAAHDDETAVLVHGDVHQWNALRADDGFKLVDPDGLLADAAYDLGVIMREDPVELLDGDPTSRARWLAARTGLDAVAIWEWGVVERVSTGLFCAEIDLQPVGREMLHAADQVVDAWR
ncbi:MAG: aminoglycoside phosphotransferase family protein [Actinomycetota bacterium]